MQTFQYLFIVTVLLVSSSSGFAQSASTGNAEIDQRLNNAGLSILESSVLKIEAGGEVTLPLTCYGGNSYYIGTAHNGDANQGLRIEIKNGKGDLYFAGAQGGELDLRFIHGKFSMTLSVKNPHDVPIPEFLLVKAYRSASNTFSDYSANYSENAYYTLEGIRLIEEGQQGVIEELELYLTNELTRQGYSVSGAKTLVHDGKKETFSYTFYRENDYVIFGLGANGTPVSFQLIDPASQKKNPFSDEIIERKERIIQHSEEGVIGASFRDKNPNLWAWAIRPDYKQQSFGSLSVFMIGYRSSGNDSAQAGNNKPEKFYVR